jgi:HK97 family phage portal protein
LSRFSFFRRATQTAADAATEQRSLAGPEDWLIELFAAAPALSGVSVSPHTALRVPAVRAAVELIAGTTGTLPVKVFQSADGTSKEVAHDHPAASIVHRDANPWTSAGALRSQLTMDAMLNGGGFAFANRDRDGRVVELVRLSPTAVMVETDTLTGEPRFRVTEGRGQHIYGFRDIIHIAPLASLDGVKGEAPIRSAREAIGLAVTLEAHAARLFANQARPSGILSFAKSLTADAAAKMKQSWQSMTANGGTAVLDADATYTALTLKSTDSQFLELRQFQILEIARAFNVPPTFLADFSRATWSNITEANRQLVTFCLMPWFRAWEAAYRRVLLSDEDRQAGITVEFVVDGLLQGNATERAEAVAKWRAAGVMTANEARRLENLPAMDGGNKLENPYTSTGKAENLQPVAKKEKADA